ncbi:hypothetical protein BOTBODRAFT_39191 [Botryobasidium botryosum FD-172 SS1]|uniref:Peptidase A1 domain-containing protein n=1 Tax=Botryobasidium botryosum (strain FD-172 SS1) TaxID=930990 RepID=A0A067LV11_BOTB1|nr:hypothetical protein BOTBODRAFT_39191 [Botryobasidium botryosum FD-172 SS1]
MAPILQLKVFFVALQVLHGVHVQASVLVKSQALSNTIPITRHTAAGSRPRNVVQLDRSRINDIKSRVGITSASLSAAERLAVNNAPLNATNDGLFYSAIVHIGASNTPFNFIVDTGSGNTWIGGNKTYVPSSTSIKTADMFNISYGMGFAAGDQYLDQVTLGTFTISNQSIGVASTFSGVTWGCDGILGLGPTTLTKNTLTTSGYSTIPTVPDNLHSQGKIAVQSFGVYFQPATSASVTDGELCFGEVDTSKITGPMTYAALSTTVPAAYYWSFSQSIQYGSTSMLANGTGIVDTGSSLIYVATDAFNVYKTATGAQTDPTTGFLEITAAQYATLQDISFVVNGTTFTLTPNAQLWPRSLNALIKGVASSYYLVFQDTGAPSGSGFDFIMGYAFLERFYSYYDTTNSRMGFATTSFSNATTN